MKPGRIVALVVGIVLLLIAIPMIAGGIAVLVASVTEDNDGFFEAELDPLDTSTVGFTAKVGDVSDSTDAPQWALDRLDVDFRVRVTTADAENDVFVGLGNSDDVRRYLDGVAHAEITDIEDSAAQLSTVGGGDEVAPPAEQGFWIQSAAGPGTQGIDWELQADDQTLVVMNADGSPGVRVDSTVGVKIGALVPLAITVLVIGSLLLIVALILIVIVAVRGARRDRRTTIASTSASAARPPTPSGGAAAPLPPPPPPPRPESPTRP